MKSRLVWVLPLAIVLLQSCNMDAPVNDELLHGNWEIVTAKRNGRSTKTLDGAVFEFMRDGTMRTNLTGDAVVSEYRVDDNLVTQTLHGEEVTYSIVEITDSSLYLTSVLEDVPFEFGFRKVSGEDTR
jgi:hypothetical protein